MNLYEFYSYKLIGKVTAFLQLQESSLRKMIVEASTTAGIFQSDEGKKGRGLGGWSTAGLPHSSRQQGGGKHLNLPSKN